MLVVVVHSFLFFILLSSLFFLLLFFIHFCHSVCFCCSFHCFSTSCLTLPWTIAGFLHPFYSFSPAHCRVICNTFILPFPRSSFSQFYCERFSVGIFYPQAFFTLRSFTAILPAFIKASLGAGRFYLKCAGPHTDPRNTGLAHLFVWFTVIHNLLIQNDSFLNSTKHYHELLAAKV